MMKPSVKLFQPSCPHTLKLFVFCFIFLVFDVKDMKTPKKFISTVQGHAKQPFTGQNTQLGSFHECDRGVHHKIVNILLTKR